MLKQDIFLLAQYFLFNYVGVDHYHILESLHVNIMYPQVPWANCNADWADDNCFGVGGLYPCSHYNVSGPTATINCTTKTESSATQFWK